MDAEPAPEAEADAEPAPEDAEGEEAPEGVAEGEEAKPPEATTRRSPSRRPWMSRPSTCLTRPREGTSPRSTARSSLRGLTSTFPIRSSARRRSSSPPRTRRRRGDDPPVGPRRRSQRQEDERRHGAALGVLPRRRGRRVRPPERAPT